MGRFAFVEFADEASVPQAMAMTGQMIGDRAVKVNFAKNAIVKPTNVELLGSALILLVSWLFLVSCR